MTSTTFPTSVAEFAEPVGPGAVLAKAARLSTMPSRPPHHIVHWIDDGDTSLDNLVLLCGTHHRIVHGTPWQVRLSPSDRSSVHPASDLWVRDRFALHPPDQRQARPAA